MPRPILYVLLVLVTASLVPIGLVYKERNSPASQTRLQVVWDMDDQFTAKTQAESEFFADGMTMQHHPAGTVARGMLEQDDAYFRGQVAGDTLFVESFPLEITKELVYRGQERFDIYCAPCHGLSGNGNGLVHVRASALGEGTWTPPTDLRDQTVSGRSVGHIYNSIKNGIRTMPAYGSQISPRDRWAIVSYVRALQLSRNAQIEDVPEALRANLLK